MNKSGLILRLTIVVIFTAFVVGVVASQVFYRITYVNEVEATKNNIGQLFNTVSSTAAIATYLEDEELINEVISGLMTNDIIKSVAIKTSTLNAQSKDFVRTEFSQEFELYSPFQADRKVGVLTITPNLQTIRIKASQISWDNQVAITVQAAVIILAVIIISYLVITKPIITIANRLHLLSPGTKARVAVPQYHKFSEIGGLVNDINNLLEKNSVQIVEERKLRIQVERLSKNFKLIFENSNSPIILTEANGNIILYNKAFIELLERLNVSLKQSFGPYLKELFEDSKTLDSVVERAFSNNEFASGEFQLQTTDAQPTIWVQAIISSTVTDDYHEYYQITLHDISLRRQQVEQLNVKAHTDELTQLLNRRGAEKEIQRLIDISVPFALLLLDLNKFKPINDVHGHDAGDEVLNHVALQMTNAMRNRDILARWGGDEFVIVLPRLSREEVMHACNKLQEAIEKPYFLVNEQQSVSVSACVGVTFFPDEYRTLEQLIHAADEAMYSMKKPYQSEQQIVFHDSLDSE